MHEPEARCAECCSARGETENGSDAESAQSATIQHSQPRNPDCCFVQKQQSPAI
jgi:hypothetical protein